MALTFDPRFGINAVEAVTGALRIPEYVAELRHHSTLADQRNHYEQARKHYVEARAGLHALRTKGFLWFPTLEQSFRALTPRAEAVTAALREGVGSTSRPALEALEAAATQVRALGDAVRNPALAGALVQQFNTAARQVAETTQNLDRDLGGLVADVNRLRALIQGFDAMMDRFAATGVPLAGGEHLLLALKAKWDDAPSGEQKGVLVLTDQRLVFFHEQQQAVAGRWFAREKVQVRELALDRPLSAITRMQGGTEGWVFKDQVLHIQFNPAAGPPAKVQIEVASGDIGGLPDDFDEATEWADMVRVLIAGGHPERAATGDAAALPDLPTPDAPAAPPAPPPPPPRPALRPRRALQSRLPWMEVELGLSPDGYLTVAVPGSSFGLHLPPTELRTVRWTMLQEFAKGVRQLAYDGMDLNPESRTLAWQLFGAVFQGRVGSALHMGRGMAAANRGQLLVRLMIPEPSLRAVPWEVMCGPDDESDFLAHHRDIQVVRGLYGAHAAEPGLVGPKPRALVVAPGELAEDGVALAQHLRAVTGDRWVVDEPLVGPAATWTALTEHLQHAPDLTLLHVMAHGRLRDGVPEIKLAGHGSEWTPAELIADALADAARGALRVVYLESCVSGEAGELASAGERLAAAGVPAVIAHLWPVSVRGARVVASRFYEVLLSGQHAGDVAEALDAARLCAAGNLRSAEFLCPVLFLRGDSPQLLGEEPSGDSGASS